MTLTDLVCIIRPDVLREILLVSRLSNQLPQLLDVQLCQLEFLVALGDLSIQVHESLRTQPSVSMR